MQFLDTGVSGTFGRHTVPDSSMAAILLSGALGILLVYTARVVIESVLRYVIYISWTTIYGASWTLEKAKGDLLQHDTSSIQVVFIDPCWRPLVVLVLCMFTIGVICGWIIRGYSATCSQITINNIFQQGEAGYICIRQAPVQAPQAQPPRRRNSGERRQIIGG
ncbi:uncharacterized protein [Dermacentor andersoni]|uniref:uncharacterized protein isoform X2 n=1 Tax=Dermacentor andersoni TaxID=34620 RepID=UPI003B3BCA92